MDLTMEQLLKGITNPRKAMDFINRRSRIALFNKRKATYIFEEEWDLLVVLDACRYDLMETVAKQRDASFDVGSVYSPASITRNWMARNFSDNYDDEKLNTAYIVAAPWSETKLSAEKFGLLDEVWRNAFDSDLGTIPPESVLDRAVAAGRDGEYDRIIAHFMQPHFPAINYPELGSEIALDEEGWPGSIWEQLESGEVTEGEVWEAYNDNLNSVLDHVEVLVKNIDAPQTILTSDHGNEFGEHGLFGHPGNYLIKELRRVPWCKLEAQDTMSYVPEFKHSNTKTDREEQLRALGYR